MRIQKREGKRMFPLSFLYYGYVVWRAKTL